MPLRDYAACFRDYLRHERERRSATMPPHDAIAGCRHAAMKALRRYATLCLRAAALSVRARHYAATPLRLMPRLHYVIMPRRQSAEPPELRRLFIAMLPEMPSRC